MIAISLMVIVPIVWLIIEYIDRNDKVKSNTGSALYRKRVKKNPFHQSYLFFSRFFLTRAYIDKISRRYEILCPSDPKTIASKTMSVAYLTGLLCMAEVFIVFVIKPSWYHGILSVILIYVINNEVMNYMVSKAEINLLEQMITFVSNVRHNYHINRMVDDSILLSMDDLGPEMKVHANLLYEIVISNNIKEKVQQYNTTNHNKYLKMFLSLCISVLEFSDKKVNGQLLFTTNLENLKREINIEILKLKKLKYVFSGTVFMSISVCLPIDAIQSFGKSIAPDLNSFYHGRSGIIFLAIILISSVVVYLRNNSLKEANRTLPKNYRYLEKFEKIRFIKMAADNYLEKNYGKMVMLQDSLKRIGETISPRQFLLRRLMLAVLAFSLSLSFNNFLHYNNRYNLTHKIGNMEAYLLSTGTTQKELLEKTTFELVEQNKKKQVTEEGLLTELVQKDVFYNTLTNKAIAKEVKHRIDCYQLEYLRWYELLICFVLGLIGYYIPYGVLYYKKRLLTFHMEEEVIQYNSIIYMMMYIEHITVKDILEQLELFAVVFKSSLRECINDYNSGDIEALLRMKEKEKFGPLQRLVDNLIRCDIIPIEKAFDEITSDRENYFERRKQENEISIQKRADTAKIISWIPGLLVLAYLLIPILIASLKELEGFKEGLDMLGI